MKGKRQNVIPSDAKQIIPEWRALNLSTYQEERIRRTVMESFEKDRRSLFSVWIDLVRVDPIKVFAFTTASATAALIASPLGPLLLSLLG